MNNAIDAEKFSYNANIAAELKKKLQLENKIVIGHVGNFVPEKNHTFLLRIFKEVYALDKNSILLLVGGGNDIQTKELAIELGIENAVMFLGVRHDVINLLQAFDLFLFPSINEGLPVTLIEAQAAGLKVIASDEISKELQITALIQFISLQKKPSYWAEKIFENLQYVRKNTVKEIIIGNYDIKNNASLLQDFYLKATT